MLKKLVQETHTRNVHKFLASNILMQVRAKLASTHAFDRPSAPHLFLADRTATQYDRLLASSCCPSVRLSVCDAVHCGSHGWCTAVKVVPT